MTPDPLPIFDGQQVVATHLSLSGTIREQQAQPGRILRWGDDVTMVVRGLVRIGMSPAETGIIRVATVQVAEAYELPAEQRMLLAALRDQARATWEDRLGNAPLR